MRNRAKLTRADLIKLLQGQTVEVQSTDDYGEGETSLTLEGMSADEVREALDVITRDVPSVYLHGFLIDLRRKEVNQDGKGPPKAWPEPGTKAWCVYVATNADRIWTDDAGNQPKVGDRLDEPRFTQLACRTDEELHTILGSWVRKGYVPEVAAVAPQSKKVDMRSSKLTREGMLEGFEKMRIGADWANRDPRLSTPPSERGVFAREYLGEWAKRDPRDDPAVPPGKAKKRVDTGTMRKRKKKR